jgi:hypothetical protein
MRLLVFIVTLLASAAAWAQDGGRKQAHAVRVANGAIRVDGRLDERT